MATPVLTPAWLRLGSHLHGHSSAHNCMATPVLTPAWLRLGSHLHGCAADTRWPFTLLPQSVHLRVPRTLYIDSELPIGQLSLLGSNPLPGASRIPPGGRGPVAMHVAEMSEAAFHADFDRLSAALSAEHVAAVYEDGLPLHMHAALVLGCTVQVRRAARAQSLAADWRLADFEPAAAAAAGGVVPYLGADGGDGAEGLGPVRYVAVYQSRDASGTRGVLSAALPSAGVGLVVVVQPSAAAAQEVLPGLAEKVWHEVAVTLESGGATRSRMSFTVEYVQVRRVWALHQGVEGTDSVGRVCQGACACAYAPVRGHVPGRALQGTRLDPVDRVLLAFVVFAHLPLSPPTSIRPPVNAHMCLPIHPHIHTCVQPIINLSIRTCDHPH
eukprot:351386-Chlamydomonas_euryale.AAC.1